MRSSKVAIMRKEFHKLLIHILEENKALVRELNTVHKRYAEVFQRLDRKREEEIVVSRMTKDIAEQSRNTCKSKLDEKLRQIESLQQQMNQLKVCWSFESRKTYT